MRRIATIVEGHGEVEAVPILLRRIARHRAGLDEDARPPEDPEAVRGAKAWLSARMPPGRPYRETIHQASFSTAIDLDRARSAPSFDKLVRDVRFLLAPEA